MKTNYLKIILGIVAVVVRVFIVAIVVYGIYRGALIAYDYGYRVYAEAPMSTGAGRTISVTITDDMSPKEMGVYFVEKGLVRDSRLFLAQYYLSEYRKDIMPGVYDVSTSMTIEEMFAVMAGVNETENTEE